MKDLNRETDRAPLNRTITLSSREIKLYTRELLRLEKSSSSKTSQLTVEGCLGELLPQTIQRSVRGATR